MDGYSGPERRHDNEDGALQRSVEAIVRRELASSEARLEARIGGLVDDLRSEIRALKRVDEALDARIGVTETKAESMQSMNQEQINSGVKAAVHDMFSPRRVVAGVGLALGLVTGALALAMQIAALT